MSFGVDGQRFPSHSLNPPPGLSPNGMCMKSRKADHDCDMAHHWQFLGFGWELGKAALDRGDNVVATARRPEQLDPLAQVYGESVRTVALDVTDTASARAAVQAAVDNFGSLDVVVNNAGYANSAPIEEMTDDDFRAQIETNLFGVFNVTKAALPVLHKQRSGHFVQFSSIGGRVGGSPGLGAYQTAKFGVEGFSEVLNAEVKPLGIKVTIIEPGGFRTDWGGSSMGTLPVGEDYEQTVGEMNRYPSPPLRPGEVTRPGRPGSSSTSSTWRNRHFAYCSVPARSIRGKILPGSRSGS